MKIPEQAKQAFKGVIFEIFQWEQEMFDGTTETFELAKRENSVETIVVQDNKIVFAFEEQPLKGHFHSLLGGKQNPDETPLEAAKRELLEESGMTSDDWELLRVYDTSPRMEWQNYIFIARNAKSVAKQNLDPGERITLASKPFPEFIELITSQNFRVNPHFVIELLKMKYTEFAKLEELKKKLGLA